MGDGGQKLDEPVKHVGQVVIEMKDAIDEIVVMMMMMMLAVVVLS